jgi:MYXO-CTERM domain-containing protein
VLSFNTAVPTVATLAATAVSSTGATLNGSATPNGTATTGWFRYSPTDPVTCNDAFGTRVPSAGGTSIGAGSSPVPYAQPLGGLAPATTYYFCALASNEVGTSFGAVLSFTTPGAPAVVTQAATGLAGGGATLNGAATPNNDTATGWFRYAATSPGTCHDGFGTRVPQSGGTALGAGTAPVTFSQSITGLMPGSTYFACAFAANSLGTAAGAPVAFTVPSMAPVVATVSATPLTSTTARLDGSANPSGAATSGWFRYDTADPGACNDAFGTRAPTTGGTALGSGNAPVAFTRSLQGLVPGTTYYYCAVAANSTGTSFGPVLSFTMPSPPVAVTLAATAVGDTGATLNGTANPNGSATLGWFRYATSNPGACSDTFGTRLPATGGTALGSGSTSMTFSQAGTGLAPDTVYYFCAIASNSIGVATGTVFSFRTPTMPNVVTNLATPVTSSGATLHGSANPKGATTTAWFRYATTNPGTCSDGFGTRAPATGGAALGSGTSPVDFSLPVTGLVPGTVYYVCALASNAVGTSTGALESFTTPAAAPFVATLAPTDPAPGAITLQGSGSSNGDPGLGWFRFATVDPGACDDSFGTRVPASGGTALGSSSDAVPFSQPLMGLSPGATYYYCALASNSLGTTPGAVRSFTMPALPSVSTAPASSIAEASAVLHGEAIPRGTATQGWFRYDTSDPGSCHDSFGTRVPVTDGAALGAGTDAVAFSESPTGLVPDTLYYFCAFASNAAGTAAGTVQSFRTSAAPAVVTAAATVVASRSATLNGTANPKGESATGWFRYATTNPAVCDDSFGTRAPASGGLALGAGTGAIGYSQPVSDLLPGTTYYYCALASNALGTTAGAVLSFTTAAAPPSVETTGAAWLTGTTATLGGAANPGGTATNGWFRYSAIDPGTCNDTFGTRAPATGGAPLGAGAASVSYAQPITGLQPGTTYFFCALADSAQGSALGEVRSFTTPAAPAVTTATATSITDREATLHGSAAPSGTATTAWFRYGTTNPGACNDSFGTRAPTADGAALGAGADPVAFSQPLAGLLPDTTYFFCALASNAGGLAAGTIGSFRTSAAPAVVTAAATVVASRSATLNGTADPKGESATGWFRYAATNPGICDDNFGTRVPASGGIALGAGITPEPYALALTGLDPGTTYYFCALARNTFGLAAGAVLSFATPAAPPVPTTLAASGFAPGAAVLDGTVNPSGGSTTGWFRYDATDPGSCNDTFGTRVPAAGTALGSGHVAVALAQPLSGLAPGVTYYFCAIAANAAGTATGAVHSFTMPELPSPVTLPATALADTSATLHGSANPNGTATTAWFRYATEAPAAACDDTFGIRAPAMGGLPLGAGTSAVPVSQALAALAPNTTYYYCLLTSNTGGLAAGAVLSFRTPAAPVTTSGAASAVGPTAATLNGLANPTGDATTGWFRYATTNPGTCSDLFGTRAPAAGGSALGSGTTAVSFAQALSGLTPGTTYYACAIAGNAWGTTFGTVISFRTAAVAPAVATAAATLLSGTSAQLAGSAVPNGEAATGWFRYGTLDPGTCSDTFGTRAPATGGTLLGAGNANVLFIEPITGLEPGHTYYYCAVSSSAAGTSVGEVRSFATPALPAVSTAAATAVTDTAATIQGTVAPYDSAGTAWFRYAANDPGACDDAFGTRMPAVGGTSIAVGSTPVGFSQTLHGLAPGTTYYFCALASNAAGVSKGAVLAFRTQAVPAVSTDAPTLVTTNTARLNGSATPNGASTGGWFRYDTIDPGSCNDGFGTRVPVDASAALGSGTAAASFAQTISGLQPGTTYFTCALAANAYGTATGVVRSFRTLAVAPETITEPAVLLAGTTVQLRGSANPHGAAASGWFRYGTVHPGSCSEGFGTRAPSSGGTPLGGGNDAVTFAETVTGLAPGTTYFTCAVAGNDEGTTYGTVESFETAPLPLATTLPATLVGLDTATLQGAGTPNGHAATGWFRYSTTDPASCNDEFGTRVPATGSVQLGAGASTVAFSQPVAALPPGTTHYYCAIVSNAGGTAFGDVLAFTTELPTAPPDVTSEPASEITSATATLSGTANPNHGETTGWFRLSPTAPSACSDAFGTRVPLEGETSLGSGDEPVAFSEAVAGLVPGTTYHYCAIAANPAGTRFGEVLSFTTAAAVPDVTTLPATDVERGEATLRGTAVANGAATTAWFRYASTEPERCDDAFGTRAPAPGFDLGEGNQPVAFSERISGLTYGERIYYCAIASNSQGLSFGEVLSIVPGESAPNVTTEEASAVGETAATLSGTVSPMGTETLAWFRFGEESAEACSDAFGRRVPDSGGVTIPAGETTVTFDREVSGLEPAATYHYCAAASNAGGASFGELRSFQTAPVPPMVQTTGVASGADGTLILQGLVDPRGSETRVWFRHGTNRPEACDDNFGERTAEADDANVGAGRAVVAVAQSVSPWGEGTHYFCAVASNQAGTAYGEVLSTSAPKVAETGCGCRTAGDGTALWLLPALALLLRRRRRIAGS